MLALVLSYTHYREGLSSIAVEMLRVHSSDFPHAWVALVTFL